MHRRRSLVLFGVVSAMVVTSSSCATTIVETRESQSTSPPSTVQVVTTPPPSTTVEVLDAMHTLIGELSEIVAATGGPRAFDHLDRIETLWERARPAIQADHTTLLSDFERMMALCRLAVERRRPAEADKAFAFLTPLIAAVTAGA
jgi:hypothetical protein